MIKHTSIVGLFALCLLAGCEQIPGVTDTLEENRNAQNTRTQHLDLRWLDYADPVADANLAMGKSQFWLVSIDPVSNELPGIDLANTSLQSLQTNCGIEIVAGTNNNQSPALIQSYATKYNQTVVSACRRQTMR